ncbi:MAG: hypothetical protein LPH21_09355 [Shewanella sp.]|nr:hypothetical protein [Shewanella sp.]
MNDSLTDFTALHEAMTEDIGKAMPMLRTVKAYNSLKREQVNTPAVLIEAGEMKPGTRLTGGRLAVNVEFIAHCMLSVKTPNVELEIRNFAGKLMQHVAQNRWGLGESVEAPTELSAFPGSFKPDDHGYESWVVTWSQTVHLGEVWQEADFLPAKVWLGEAPNIGAGHEDDYKELT